MLTKRTKYALKTLMYLYEHEGDNKPVSAKSIAENENIPWLPFFKAAQYHNGSRRDANY
jgi:DNA-binding IscR family transcriptional regulator